MNLPETLEKILKLSRADAVMVIGEEQSVVNLRWANNSLTTNGEATSQELFVISVIHKAVGVAGASFVTEEGLEELVRQSEEAAKNAQPAADYQELVAGKADKHWDDTAGSTDIYVFQALAKDLGKLFKQAASEDIRLYGYAEHSVTTSYLATSTGLRKRHEEIKGQLELNAKDPDLSRSVWVGSPSQTFEDIDAPKLYEQLKTRLEWSKNRIELEPGRYETILTPSAMADMMIYAYWSMAARDADEGRNVFSAPGGKTKLGQTLFPKFISLYSDPSEPGMRTAPFELAVRTSSEASVFDNGIELGRSDWIKNGELTNLITPRYWAQMKRRQPSPYINNLIMPSDSKKSLDEMIKETKRGLLVNCLWYIREVDPQTLLLTGLTRDGVYLIEDGEIKGAVNNFRFNMSPIEMLANTIEIGQAQPALAREWGDYFTHALMPPGRIKDFNMSSVSQAS